MNLMTGRRRCKFRQTVANWPHSPRWNCLGRLIFRFVGDNHNTIRSETLCELCSEESRNHIVDTSIYVFTLLICIIMPSIAAEVTA